MKETQLKWQDVWRRGAAPLLPTAGLLALRQAILSDDPRLLQGATTTPSPLECVMDWPVESACLLGFCGWIGDGLDTVAEVEAFFNRACFNIDQTLEEPAGCRWLLNWFDETPRQEMLAALLPEVELEIQRREDLLAMDQRG